MKQNCQLYKEHIQYIINRVVALLVYVLLYGVSNACANK